MARQTLWICALVALLGCALSHTLRAQAVTVNDEFAPSFNDTVNVVETDPRGKLLFGGLFTEVNGQVQNRLTRLLGHGGIDPDFNASVAGAVTAIAATSDDRVLVGGFFPSVNGVARANFAVLANDGSTISAINPQFNFTVFSILAIEGTAEYYVGGAFDTVSGLRRSRIALMSGGNVVPGFAPTNLTGAVRAIARQRDGKVLITGDVRPVAAATSQGPVLRLNADGSLDPSFFFASSGVSDIGRTLTILPDSRILIGGVFTSQSGATRYLLRLNSDGTIDPNFLTPTLNGAVRDAALQDDGRIVIVGEFTGLSLRDRVARLNADGSLDASYAPLLNPNAAVNSVTLQRHQGAVFAGAFTEVTGQVRMRAARLGYRGEFDTRFASNVTGGQIEVMAGQPDGKVLIGGDFTRVNGSFRPYVARLNRSGSTDASFNVTPNNDVDAIAVLPDRSVLLAGLFNAINTVPRLRIAKITPTGIVDPDFNVAVNGGSISTMTLQGDGKILIGGSFTSIGTTPRVGIARLNADGSLDMDFAPTPQSTFTRVRAIAVRADDVFGAPGGQIYLGGTTNGVNRLERLMSNGTLDGTFQRINAGDIVSITTSTFGPVRYGGFTGTSTCGRFLSTVDGSSLLCLASPNQPVLAFLRMVQGDIFAAGTFDQIGGTANPVIGLTKIVQAGSSAELSDQFAPQISGDAAAVNALLLQDDGKLLFAGAFTTVDGQTRERIARSGEHQGEAVPLSLVTRSAGIKTEWDFSTRTARFSPGGADLELERAPVLLISNTCCSADDFAVVSGERASLESLATQAWIKTNVPVTSAPFYLRWRYFLRDGRGGTSLYESPILRVVPRSPELSYLPTPNVASSTIIFPSGAAGSGLRQITVTPTGTEGGTTQLSNCAISNIVGSASFEVVRAVPSNFTWERTQGVLEIRCTRTPQLSTAQLSCAPIASDGALLPQVVWGLTCPAASASIDPIFASSFE